MARILIVEDEVIVARDLETSLTEMGHSVVGMAMDAAEALSIAEEEKPDLALVDIRIKGDRDGITLAAYLKEDLPIRIVFLTSHADPETVERASTVKPSGYLLKPYTDESLFACLTVVLSQSDNLYRPVDLAALSERSTTSARLPEQVVQDVETFIAKNLDREISLCELSKLANMSESAFSRRFKASKGISPYQYVLAERLSEAKRLLRGTDWQLVDISNAIGFSSQSHFTTTFKSHVGLTPLAYRRL
ncbi:MAG: response regulator transcription factor [Pseudomonadota bacterium]